jgi:lipoprotein NlpI
VTLNPKIAFAYCNRGLARQAKGDLDGAIADYTQALAVDPKIAIAYYNRGLIKVQKNDLDGAIADSSQALDLDPKNAQAYYTRGFAKLAKGNLEGALADLKQFCDLAPKDHNADHARLYLWLISKAQNPKIDADQELSDSLENSWNSSPDDLTSKTAAFLLGRINEADYLAAAASSDAKTDQGRHCEAWYFAGMKRLLMGDKKTAIDAFHQCLATGQKDYCEYILAQAELQALEPNPPPKPAGGAGPARSP